MPTLDKSCGSGTSCIEKGGKSVYGPCTLAWSDDESNIFTQRLHGIQIISGSIESQQHTSSIGLRSSQGGLFTVELPRNLPHAASSDIQPFLTSRNPSPGSSNFTSSNRKTKLASMTIYWALGIRQRSAAAYHNTILHCIVWHIEISTMNLETGHIGNEGIKGGQS